MSSSKRLIDASTIVAKNEVSKFEGSRDNVTRSFSLLYAGGLLSKRKYAHIRSALGCSCIGLRNASRC